MRAGAIDLNTPRGPIDDLDAVVSALRGGRLGGAGFDVFPLEPPTHDSVEGVENLVVSPHMAFYSNEAIAESQTKAASCIVAVLRGQEPRYRAN